MMSTTNADTLVAPARITAATREPFRKSSLEFLVQAHQRGASAVTLDLGATEDVDASGLGLLVHLQKRSQEIGIPLRLVRVPKDVRHVLVLTRLEHLFDID
ncbi:MAG TPA: STAS domain-containing protein [Gemmatimonadaceae bacterium]|nr:STAS domain-containing protein [Gemmatimonadaceae bacterium]